MLMVDSNCYNTFFLLEETHRQLSWNHQIIRLQANPSAHSLPKQCGSTRKSKNIS